jgi:hypothetical protein
MCSAPGASNSNVCRERQLFNSKLAALEKTGAAESGGNLGNAERRCQGKNRADQCRAINYDRAINSFCAVRMIGRPHSERPSIYNLLLLFFLYN